MLRAAPIAALLVGLVLAVPTNAQVGSGRIAFSPSTDEGGIFTVDPDGSGMTFLRPRARSPIWSPDGSQIAFTDRPPNATLIQLYVMNADGSGARVIAEAPPPSFGNQAWSPDGTRIAFTGFGQRDLFVADLAGGAPRQLTSDGLLSGQPVWSPTGSQIAYSARVPPSSSVHLFVVDANSGTPTQITRNPEEPTFDSTPTWSPDGRRLAFRRRQSVYVVDADGTDLHRVADVVEGQGDALAWSPDGTRIAFSTAVNAPPARFHRGREIYVANADGSAETRLTHSGPRLVADSNPVWSPDGERLLFLRGPGPADRDEIYTMNADGTCEGRLAGATTPVPSWQPRPGMPSGGPKRCHALAVEREAVQVNGSRATIRASVVNEGTEPLTNIELGASASSEVTLTSAEVQSQAGFCRVLGTSATCRTATLERGGSVQLSIVATGQRVTSVSDPRIGVDLELTLFAGAAETTHRELLDVRFSLDRCTSGLRGGGVVVGTNYEDELCGRRGADRITPLAHRDTVQAGAGNDLVLARDGLRDLIRCGPGRDRVVVDRLDFVARDCERVSRRRVKRPPPYG